MDKRSDVVCCVLTGAGTHYSSGNDLAGLAAPAPSDLTPEQRSHEAAVSLYDFIQSFVEFSKPLIAGVNGI
jgi:peroxisomal 3,2-trans-enoyl-CoA isomerase